MKSFCDLLETWKHITHVLEIGGAVLVHSPRYYGKRRLASEILNRWTSAKSVVCLDLRVDSFLNSGKLDYSKAWDVMRTQGGLPKNHGIIDQGSFATSLKELIATYEKPLLLVIHPAGAGHEAHQFDLLSTLDNVRTETPINLRARLRLLALDDFSQYYYETLRTAGVSRWNFERVFQAPLTLEEIEVILRNAEYLAAQPGLVAGRAAVLQSLTGGHLGLIIELLDHLQSSYSDLSAEDWERTARQILQNSGILEGIRRSLDQDVLSLTEVAFQYVVGRVPRGDGNPNLRLLRQLGVVQWVSTVHAELCPGLVTDLVRKLHEAAGEVRTLGTLVSDIGPRVYDRRPENLLADPEDFVVVHMSDLHIGSGYPFQLPSQIQGREELTKRSAAGLIGADLRCMGIHDGRVDLMVMSGDFTNTGKSPEFLRAREVVDATLKEAGIPSTELLILAGNHDIEWNPPEMSQVQGENVSRENYETFRELLKFEKRQAHAELRVLRSPSGRKVLRVLALDSNAVESQEKSGIGYVREATFVEGEALLNETKPEDCDACWTWLVLHHHVYPASAQWVEGTKRPRLTVLANASDVLAFAHRVGAEVVLHGHEHQPSVTVARRWHSSPQPSFQPIVSIGCGSVSAARQELGPFSRNQYFALYRKSDQLVIRSRCISDEGLAFTTHNDLIVPLPARSDLGPGRLIPGAGPGEGTASVSPGRKRNSEARPPRRMRT